MKLICPSCGAVASAEAWENDVHWRELLQKVTSLPAPMPPTVLCYLALFRPGKSALSTKKALRLTKELVDLVATGHIQVQGKVARPCQPQHWAQAMEQMAERRATLSLPLKNHNYLRQVVWQLADAADQQREAGQRQNELNGNKQRMPGSRTEGGMSEIMRKYLDQNSENGGENEKQAD